MKTWNDRVKLIKSSKSLEVQFTFAAILFRSTFIRALMILGDGKKGEKSKKIKESQGKFTRLWRRMLSRRLGNKYLDLKWIVEGADHSLNWGKIRFAAFVTLYQIASGFDHFYVKTQKDTKVFIGKLVEASLRIKAYVESFGIGFDDRIRPAQINCILRIDAVRNGGVK